MPQRARRRRPEALARTVRVEPYAARVSHDVDRRRGLPSRLSCDSWLERRGSGDEPVQEVSEFRVSQHVDGLEQPPLGIDWRSATSCKPGHLRYCYLVFTEPKRGSAPIVSTYFSNEGPE